MSPLGQPRLYTASQKKRIYKAVSYSIINKVADLAPPALIGLAVDIVVKAEDSFLAHLGLVDTKQQLIVLVALTVFVWGVRIASTNTPTKWPGATSLRIPSTS